MSFSAANQAVSPPSPIANPHEGLQSRKKHPCVLCQQRKVKCDRNDPCANCVKARVECVSPTTLPPRRRKKRFPEAELLALLKNYEDHLRSYGADICAINREAPNAGLQSNTALTDTASPTSIRVPFSLPDSTSLEPIRSLSIRSALRNVKTICLLESIQASFQDAEEMLQGSSEDEMFENPILRTYDSIDADGGDLVFGSSVSEDIRDLHPSTVHIFRLWQRFLDSVDPLIKMFHTPTVQQQVLDATAALDEVPKGVEALMFGIYSMAIASFAERDCLSIFGETKATLLKRYQSGARLALQRAGLLRSSDLTILQAFVLYLMSCLNFTMDPRSLFCLTGIAVRISQRMGLSFDGTSYGLSPFEVEMRRRLWWQVLLLDVRVAELSGAGSALLNHAWKTKLPSNVNDSDLFPDMRETPKEHAGATEMMFVLYRCEVANLVQQLQDKLIPLTVKDEAIDELEMTLERKYIQYCDRSIPFHLVTTLMVKLATAKIRMLARHPHLRGNIPQNLIEDRDYLFKLSLQCLENHNQMMAIPSLDRFMWHVLTNFPFPAQIYLLCSLRLRTSDALAERAWELLEMRFENQNLRINGSEFWRRNKDSAIYLATANLMIKAWEAREKAFKSANSPLRPTPDFINRLRAHFAAKRPPKSTSSWVGTEVTTPSMVTTGMPQLPESYQWFNPGPQDPNQGLYHMPGVMTNDEQQMGWDFWNDLMQPSILGYSHEGIPLQQTYTG